MKKNLFAFLFLTFLLSCSSKKSSHNIAIEVLKYDKKKFPNDNQSKLFHLGHGIYDKSFYNEIIAYKTKFENKNSQKLNMLYFEKGYEWLVTDKEIDSILRREMRKEHKAIYWKEKYLKKFDIIIENKKIEPEKDLKSNEIIDYSLLYYVSKPLFIKKDISLVYYTTSLALKTNDIKLIILVKENEKWRVVCESCSSIM